MKLKEVLIIGIIIVLFSGCSSKDEFYRWGYNWIQDDKFCTNTKECEDKRLHSNDYSKKENISYDEYKIKNNLD